MSNVQFQFPKTSIEGSSGNIADVDSNGNLKTTGSASISGTVTEQTALNAARTTEAAITFSSSGVNIVVAGMAATSVRVYRLFLVVAGATNLTFQDSSGSPVLFTGAIALQANGSIVLDFSDEPWFTTTSAKGFNINSSNAVQVSGALYYTQVA